MRFFCFKNQELRLRVVAHSDSEGDQARKRKVCDAVLPLALRQPFDMTDIRAAARRIDPTARVRYGRLRFGGYYSPAIEVTLGAGAGHNWWGVLYPEAMNLQEGPVQFESWLAKLLRGWGWI